MLSWPTTSPESTDELYIVATMAATEGSTSVNTDPNEDLE